MELDFIPSRNSKNPRPIAFDNDMLCVIDNKSKNVNTVKAGETWQCSLVKQMNGFIIVNPTELKATVELNGLKLKEQVAKLKEKWQAR